MIRTVEAILDEQGRIVLPNGITFDGQRHRALVIILDETPPAPVTDTAAEQTVIVSQRYKLLDRIGGGGMGEVFRAFDEQTHNIVSLKRLFRSIRESALRQEASALRRLNHPNIIALLDHSFDGSYPYLVTEFVDGPNMSSWLRAHRPIPESLAADLMLQVFEGLAFAHSHQIIHCDLKPANVMLELNGMRLKPRILDFGIAVVDRVDDRGAFTAAGRIAGTYDYMAPEQFRGDVLTTACDVYAAGLMLAHLVTGVSKYSGLDMPAVLREKLSAQTGLSITVSTDRTLTGLIERCTHPKPERRPSAAEAAAILRVLAAGIRHPIRPINLEFKRGLAGWENGVGKVAGVSTDYLARVILDTGGGPAGVTLEALRANGEFGVLMQSFPADRLAGQRIRLEADMMTHEVGGRAALWIRVDGVSGPLAFDNMDGQHISGTTRTRKYRLETLVPEGAETIHFGLLLIGAGSLMSGPIKLTMDEGQIRPDLSLISSSYPPEPVSMPLT